ncbi:MAG: hypothetical protein MRJ68_09200 [Nitrospira sp.]|nr:hypothetical protein [Nitrospira sp.]
MDRQSMKLQDTGLRLLSIKPRLLKCTMLSTGSQKSKGAGAKQKDYSSAELLEDNVNRNGNSAPGRMDLSK